MAWWFFRHAYVSLEQNWEKTQWRESMAHLDNRKWFGIAGAPPLKEPRLELTLCEHLLCVRQCWKHLLHTLAQEILVIALEEGPT